MLGLELILVSWHLAHRCRLPFLSGRVTVTFSTKEHHCPLAGTISYCMMTGTQVWVACPRPLSVFIYAYLSLLQILSAVLSWSFTFPLCKLRSSFVIWGNWVITFLLLQLLRNYKMPGVETWRASSVLYKNDAHACTFCPNRWWRINKN